MDEVKISGKLISPDGTEEFWWNSVNYHNVIPEELIDAELESASKIKEREEKQMGKYKTIYDYMRERDCLFGIEPSVTVELVEKGLLTPIICKKPERVGITHLEPVNGYFKIEDTNLVWMHVQNGYGVIINEYVKNQSNDYVKLVDELSQYYWYIENGTSVIRAGALNNRILYSCIESIIVYDDIKKRIKNYMDVHHKGRKWCNTQNTMSVVCRDKHKYYHNEIGTRRSHRKGVMIRSVEEFIAWRDAIISEDKKLKKQLM